MKEEKEKFYITTAIAYASVKPHIGNTYEAIFADAVARYKRMQGYDVYFMTGTDEHGQKIQELAKGSGKEPQEYVDGVAEEIKRIWDLVGTSYDRFIRTTEIKHKETVNKIFKRLYDQGDIYKGFYEGWYCTPCESFFTESQLEEGNCPDCGRPLEQAREEAYFLKLSKYANKLIKHIEDNPTFIEPEARRKEIINNFIKPGLQDLCVSRTSFAWGVPVEFDPGHVVYVWIDALSNYITGLGYELDKKDEKYEKYWPADLQVIGKDILRFHMIYWPIMLMALGEPLPKQIYAHGWLLFADDKMSKSKGNVIYADDLVELFGIDATRFYVLSEMPYAQDGSITYENIISKYNSELANTLGNLVNRTVAMSNKYFDGIVENKGINDSYDKELSECTNKAINNFNKKMNTYKIQEAIHEIWSLVRRCNKYIDETTPWILAKEENKDRLKTVLYNLIEVIRIIGIMISPIMPATADKIFEYISSSNNQIKDLKIGKYISGTKVCIAKPLFERLDEAKKIEEIKEKIGKGKEKVEENKEEIKTDGLITIDELDKVKLIVGQIKEVSRTEGADKLYC
ncbi:MAG: methionine--tRNA ligase, partial [Clostridia bacterium]|nr:methionine--tRNA ligase [Clostridia bacterium]